MFKILEHYYSHGGEREKHINIIQIRKKIYKKKYVTSESNFFLVFFSPLKISFSLYHSKITVYICQGFSRIRLWTSLYRKLLKINQKTKDNFKILKLHMWKMWNPRMLNCHKRSRPVYMEGEVKMENYIVFILFPSYNM
jgi:hypothetical protein